MSEQPIILGGGLAGLSACYHGDGIIYEKTQKTGGHASSHEKIEAILEAKITLLLFFFC